MEQINRMLESGSIDEEFSSLINRFLTATDPIKARIADQDTNDAPTPPLLSLNLSLAGLVLLADSRTLAIRTTLTGARNSLLDALLILPGLHCQTSTATTLHQGEYPACAAMTSGYVFRVENPATVFFLQRIGRPGCLTTVEAHGQGFAGTILGATMLHLAAILATCVTVGVCTILKDWWMLTVLGMLVLVRLINIRVLRHRATPGWFGASEPGVRGDLLVLLSQDRWIRIRGLVDDLKAVTSATWLQEPTAIQRSAMTLTNLMVFLSLAFVANATTGGQILLLCLVTVSTGLIGLLNQSTKTLCMHGRTLRVSGMKQYSRRLVMAEGLINETGRSDWAIRMGIVQPGNEDDAVKDPSTNQNNVKHRKTNKQNSKRKEREQPVIM